MKIMSFIRRHAAALALLSILMAAAAAPYMIPADPDSAVFRSGALPLILLFGCYAPLRDAYAQDDRRALTVSLVFGFLFALALSLGSELFVYDGLIKGLGSLVRRAAVPVMAAPLFGGLCLHLAARQGASPGMRRQLPARWFALVIFLCWTPLLAAYFPGMLNYDFPGQFAQHTSGQYTNLHPLLHSALCNGVIALGEAIHSRTLGVMMMSLLQMALFALALGGSCSFAARRGAPRWALALLTGFYALHPVFSAMALSMTKDTLFAAAVLTLSLDTYEIIDDPAGLTKGRAARFILCTAGTALLRGNGIFALAFLFPALIAVSRGARRRTACLCALGAAAAALTLGLLTLALRPASMPSFQLYSLPAQQLVRAYNTGDMTPEERAELESWYTSPAGLALHPHLADPAKGYLDHKRLEQEGDQLLDLWQRVGKKNPHAYAEALLMLNVGSWYADDLSHSTIYPDVSWNDKGYLQTQEYDMSAEGINASCFLPAVREWFERICRRNEHQKYPIAAVLFNTAVPFWGLMLACAIAVVKRRAYCLPAALGAFGLWLSYLLGPCTLPRYALPLFCLAPVLLLTLLFAPRRDADETHP